MLRRRLLATNILASSPPPLPPTCLLPLLRKIGLLDELLPGNREFLCQSLSFKYQISSLYVIDDFNQSTPACLVFVFCVYFCCGGGQVVPSKHLKGQMGPPVNHEKLFFCLGLAKKCLWRFCLFPPLSPSSVRVINPAERRRRKWRRLEHPKTVSWPDDPV